METSKQRWDPRRVLTALVLVVFGCGAMWLAAGGQAIESGYYLAPLVEYCGVPRGVATWVVLQWRWDRDRMPWCGTSLWESYRHICDEALGTSPRP